MNCLQRREFLRCAGGSLLAFTFARMMKAEAVVAPRFVLEFGKQGKGPGEFDSPVGLVIDAEDRLYVTDFLNKRVQWFAADGSFLGQFPVQPYPGGLARDEAGLIYVAHWNDSKIAVYSPTGELLRQWGGKGTGDGELHIAGGLAMGRDGVLYAADQGNSRIQAFTREGKYLRQWGSLGAGPGEFGVGKSAGSRFAGLQFLAVDAHGLVYATDAASGRVQKFTPEGDFVMAFGSNATEPGGFGGRKESPGPIALCVDRQGRIWVGASNHRVQLFSADGDYLAGFGGAGSDPGKFETPHGLAIDSAGFFYVVDTMNCRIQKFAVA